MTVHGPLVVPGQNRAQQEQRPVANPDRDGRDESRKTLTHRAQQPWHHPGNMHHHGEGVVIADPARQRLGRNDRRDPRDVTQQGDFPDNLARSRLADLHHTISADVSYLGGTRRDKQKRHRRLPLLHEHLTGRSAQQLNPRRQRHQILDRATREDAHRSELFRPPRDQLGHYVPLQGPATHTDRFAMTCRPCCRRLIAPRRSTPASADGCCSGYEGVAATARMHTPPWSGVGVRRSVDGCDGDGPQRRNRRLVRLPLQGAHLALHP